MLSRDLRAVKVEVVLELQQAPPHPIVGQAAAQQYSGYPGGTVSSGASQQFGQSPGGHYGSSAMGQYPSSVAAAQSGRYHIWFSYFLPVALFVTRSLHHARKILTGRK